MQEGLGISNYHVLDGAAKAFLKTNDGLSYEIDQVIASNQIWDIVKFNVKTQQVFVLNTYNLHPIYHR